MQKYKKEELEQFILIENLSYEAIGRLYDVTGAAIKKAAKRLGIELPKRRIINSNENFSHTGKSKINSFTDDQFIEIINNNIGWKNIDNALGYSGIASSDVHNKIKKRCQELNIKLELKKQSPILSKTKEELLKDRKNYQSYRSAIRKLAEAAYKNSNKPCECYICKYNKHIEIAHIKAVSEFDNSATIAEINSIDNLVALCPNHHWEYDHGMIKL